MRIEKEQRDPGRIEAQRLCNICKGRSLIGRGLALRS